MLPNSTSTKEKILSLIKENKPMTVSEIACHISITEMAVRRHIEMLETDGYLVSVLRRNSIGRPSKVFQLSEQGEEFFPQQYKQIGIDLLQEINRLDSEIINKAIHSRQERLTNRFRSRFKGKSFKGQIKELAMVQSELGFMAEEDGGYFDEVLGIKQFNCPYLDIAKDFPEICRLEMKFFEDLLNTNHIEKKSSMSKGDSCCHYLIRKGSMET